MIEVKIPKKFPKNLHNEKGSAGYQVFVASFRDGNGDKKGDLKGIIEAVPYIASLGFHYLWLTPIFKSSSYHRYDTEDYLSIDSSLGTLEDFHTLAKVVHEHGMELILDLVINHSSFRHPWYIQSAKDYFHHYEGKDSKADYYNWTKKPQYAYSYDPNADAWVEGRFSGWMPDLNLDSLSLRKELEEILSYWLKEGADGYRLDAVRFYYFEEREKTVAFLKWLKDVCYKIKANCYIVGEAWEDYPDEQSILDYASSGIPMFHFPLCLSREDGPGAAVSFLSSWKKFPYRIVEEKKKLAEVSHGEVLPALFIGNHDTDRWSEVVAVGKENQKELYHVAMSLLLWSPGTPWVYYGEEIGLPGVRNYLGVMSDAARRTAMPWKDGNLCSNPEDYIAPPFPSSVEEEEEKENSLLNRVRKLLSLRNDYNDFFTKGNWEVFELSSDLSEQMMAFLLSFQGEKILLIHSQAKEPLLFEIPFPYTKIEEVTSTHPSSIDKRKISISPYSSLLITLE